MGVEGYPNYFSPVFMGPRRFAGCIETLDTPQSRVIYLQASPPTLFPLVARPE